MKFVDESVSVIIVGKWNRYILTPEWVAEKIFQNSNLEVLFPINQPGMAPKYIKKEEGITFLPSTHRIQFIAQDPNNEDSLRKIPQYIKEITAILEHTPVTAFGINFVLEEKIENFELIELFNISDSAPLLQKSLDPISTEIKRQYQLDDCILNLGTKLDRNFVQFDFNFHHTVKSASEVNKLIHDKLILDKKAKAFEILNDIYSLQLTEEEE